MRQIFIKIQQNEADWQRWADSFAQYQQTWQRQGILVMLPKFYWNKAFQSDYW